jgi:hypothetical protein
LDWIGLVGNIVVELHEKIRPGCEQLFSSATQEFNKIAQTRELTLVSRFAVAPPDPVTR